jgi:hypothetical protein
MRQRLPRGIPGSVRFLPPEVRLHGAPTGGALVTIKSATGSDLPSAPVVDAPAVVDGVDVTVSRDAAAGERSLKLSSAAGVAAGRRYLVAGEGGAAFVVRVFAVVGDTAHLFATLPGAVPSGAAFKGAEISVDLTAAQLAGAGATVAAGPGPTPADPNLYRAAWAYTVGGADRVGACLFSVVPAVLASSLDPDDLDPYLPAEKSRLHRPDEAPGFAAAIAAAWEEVLDDVELRGIKPDRIMDPERLRGVHRLRTLVVLGSTWGAKWREWTETKAKEYEGRIEAVCSSPATWVDTNDDATQQDGERPSGSRRLVR